MARVEVVSEDESESVAQEVPVDQGPEPEQRKERRQRPTPEVEIEREVTKRKLIESVTQVVVVILYMLFTLLRDRDAGVVVLDEEGPEDDWQE